MSKAEIDVAGYKIDTTTISCNGSATFDATVDALVNATVDAIDWSN